MNFTSRYALEKAIAGTHSFLSPSSPAWVNYDEDKLDKVFFVSEAARKGVRKHALAHECIELREKLPDLPRTLNMYVNDAIGFRMQSEVLLYYSPECYGTADTASFRENKLRIHDLKTGTTVASMKQLEIYAALFCLDYDFHPRDIEIELRIYQNNTIKVHTPDPADIILIMEKIRTSAARIELLKKGD